jgi:hypothetical protein
MSWLKQESDPEVQRRALALQEEECRALSMQRPLTTEQAYRLFGTFLGLIPPFALFERTLASSGGNPPLWPVLFCVGMNVICCLVGRRFAGYLGRSMSNPRALSGVGFAFTIFLMVITWSLVTGGSGGALFFGIGAIFGAIFAAPVALIGFPAFAILHRLISRGGMIEERHTWPLAFGIPLTIAAVIMSPWVK